MPPTPTHLHDLEDLVDATRRRIKLHKLIRGAAWVELLTVGWLSLAVAFDLLTPMGVPLRVVCWIGFWLVLAAALVLVLAIPALRRLENATVAMLIERQVGGMHNRLLTVVDLRELADAGAMQGVNGAFADRLVQQTHDLMRDYQPGQVADPRPMLKTVMGACASLAFVTAMVFTFHDRVPTALARVFKPTADIAPVTGVGYAVSGDIEALQAETAIVEAHVQRGRVDGLTLQLREVNERGEATGPWYAHPMQKHGGSEDGAAVAAYRFTLDDIQQSYEYKVVGGGTWSPVHRIRMVARPTIESLAMRLTLPSYLGMKRSIEIEADATEVAAPVGSTLHVTARVGGDAARGKLRRVHATEKQVARKVEREEAWIDDQTPADVTLLGDLAWRWTTRGAHSGSRAHTFGWDRRPYGLATRFEKLVVPTDASLFTYVKLDADEPPRLLRVAWADATRLYVLSWGEQTPLGAKHPFHTLGKDVHELHLGPLPSAGRWQRLDASIERVLGAKPITGKHMEGVYFDIDRGKAMLDRVGAVRSESVIDTEQRSEVLDESVMFQIGDAGETSGVGGEPHTTTTNASTWEGHIVIRGDSELLVQFHNALGHPNAPMKPIVLRALKDELPRVVIEKPGQDVTLPQATPLPILARVLDDWGVRGVALQISKTGRKDQDFGPEHPIVKFKQPRTAEPVVTAIDPTAFGVAAGGRLYYRVVARDRKGQRGVSAVYELRVSRADASEAGKDPRSEKLQELYDQLTRLRQRHEQIDRDAEALRQQLPDAAKRAVDQAREAIQRAERAAGPEQRETAMRQAEQAARDLRHAVEQSPPAQRQAANALAQTLDTQKSELDRLARDLERAANEAHRDPAALPEEDARLGELARRADAIAKSKEESAAGDKPSEAAVANRLVEQKPTTQKEGETLRGIQREIERLQQARQAMREDPDQLQREIEQQGLERQAEQAMDLLGNLEQQLARLEEQTRNLRREAEQLAQQTPQAPTTRLGDISDAQRGVDRETNRVVDRTQPLLPEDLQRQQPPVQPWQQRGDQRDPQGRGEDMAGENAANDAAGDRGQGKQDAGQQGLQNQDAQQQASGKQGGNNPQGRDPQANSQQGNDQRGNDQQGNDQRGNDQQGNQGQDGSPPQGDGQKRDGQQGQMTQGDRNNGDANPTEGQTPASRQRLQEHQQGTQQRLATNEQDINEAQRRLEQAQRQLEQALRQAEAMRRGENPQANGQQADGQRGNRAQDPANEDSPLPGERAGQQGGDRSQQANGQPSQQSGNPSQPGQQGEQAQGQQARGQQGQGQQAQGQQGQGQQAQGQPTQRGNSQQDQGQPGQGQPGQSQPGQSQPGQGQSAQGQSGRSQGNPSQGGQASGQPSNGQGQPASGLRSALQSPQVQEALQAARRALRAEAVDQAQRQAQANGNPQGQNGQGQNGQGQNGQGQNGQPGQNGQGQPNGQQANAQGGQQAGQQAGQQGGQQAGQGNANGRPTGAGRSPNATVRVGNAPANATQSGVRLTPGERAKLYRLPPSVREPLLQGMREQGPKGYRSLIEAYYKELSRDAED